MRTGSMVVEALSLFRFAIRRAWKSPAFTIATAATLALGIAANTAVFTIVDALLLKPLPYPDSDQLVIIAEVNQKTGLRNATASYPLFTDFREQSSVFQSLAAHRHQALNMMVNGHPEQLEGELVSRDFFQVLGVPPKWGQPLGQPGTDHALLLSSGMAERFFGSGPLAVGRTMAMEGVPYTVVGVMPPDFHYPAENSVWVLLDSSRPENAEEITSRGTRRFSVIGRMKPGADIRQAASEADAIASRIASEHAKLSMNWSIRLLPLREHLVGVIRHLVLILLAAVALVLLVACANVGGLALARSLSRRQEMAVRSALGASASNILAQVICETVVQSLIGGIVGASVTAATITNIILLIAPIDLPLKSEIHVGLRAILFAAGISIVSGILAALVPGLQLARSDLNSVLNETGRGTSGRSWLYRGLVAAEIALSMIVLCGAALLVTSFVRLQQTSPGFRPDHVITFQLVRPIPKEMPPGGAYELWTGFQERLLAKLRELPSVESAEVAITTPLEGHKWLTTFDIAGHPSNSGELRVAEERLVSARYHPTMGIPLLQGRYFADMDGGDAPRRAIVNRAFVDHYLPSENPIGQQIETKAFSIGKAEIIGVVGNVHQARLSDPPNPEVYHLYVQVPMPFMTFVVRTKTDPKVLAGAIRQGVSSVDPQQSIGPLTTVSERLSQTMAYPRFQASLLGAFAVFSLLMMVVGLYSLTAYSVGRRTKEIGVRVALGAGRREIFFMMLRDSGTLVCIGLAIGLPAALALSRTVRSFLYGTAATEPSVYISASLLLAAVALGGTVIPAIRAAHVDSCVAIRHE